MCHQGFAWLSHRRSRSLLGILRQCYVESLKVASYPPVRESGKPHPLFGGSNNQVISSQVMSIVEEFLIRTLIVYETIMQNPGDTFNINPRENTVKKGPKPIEKLVKLQLGPKPKKCTQLSRDLTSHEHKHIAEVLWRNIDLFAWQPSNMPRIHPSIVCQKLVVCP